MSERRIFQIYLVALVAMTVLALMLIWIMVGLGVEQTASKIGSPVRFAYTVGVIAGAGTVWVLWQVSPLVVDRLKKEDTA